MNVLLFSVEKLYDSTFTGLMFMRSGFKKKKKNKGFAE